MQIMIPCQANAMALNSPRRPKHQCQFHCVHYCAPLFQENLSLFIYAADKRRWRCSIFATMHFNGGQASDTNGQLVSLYKFGRMKVVSLGFLYVYRLPASKTKKPTKTLEDSGRI